MKKLIITAVMSVVLGTSCVGLANSSQTRNDLISSIEQRYRSGQLNAITYDEIESLLRTKEYHEALINNEEFRNAILARVGEGLPPLDPSISFNESDIENLLSKMSQKKSDVQSENFVQKIYDSITGSRTTTKARKNDGSWFLIGPQFIYDSSKKTHVAAQFPEFINKVIAEENNFRALNSLNSHTIRASINARSQYAAIVDKAVSLQTFQEAENRFSQITQLLMEIDKTEDLKSIAELQARMKSMLAMIQNETAKLQMIVHLRNAEQALINQQKQKRTMQILSSENKTMPIIR